MIKWILVLGILVFGLGAEDLTNEEIEEISEYCRSLKTEKDCTANPENRCLWKEKTDSLGKKIQECKFNGNRKKGFQAVEDETEESGSSSKSKDKKSKKEKPAEKKSK